MAIRPMQYPDGMSGVGVDQNVSMEGGGGSSILGKFLLGRSSGGAIVWGGDMGALSVDYV